ncbi:MAG: hypothetical protein ACFFAY_05275 [Promethearchaeota archaeon]
MKINDSSDDEKAQARLLASEISEQSANSPTEQQLSSEVVDNAQQSELIAGAPPQDYGPILNAVLGSILAFGLLIPLSMLPVLILVILPAEVYLVGQIYDSLVESKSGKRSINEHTAFEDVSQENEKVRTRVYGARTAA